MHAIVSRAHLLLFPLGRLLLERRALLLELLHLLLCAVSGCLSLPHLRGQRVAFLGRSHNLATGGGELLLRRFQPLLLLEELLAFGAQLLELILRAAGVRSRG